MRARDRMTLVCVCVYSNSRNDVPRVAQQYGTIAAHTRRCTSVHWLTGGVDTMRARDRMTLVCVCVCIPILVMMFPECLSNTEPLPHTPDAVRLSSLCPGFDTRSGNILSFLLPLFQEGQLSVTGESMCTKYWLTA